MTEQPELNRYNDTERNLILNRALTDLENIINGHDPEVDVPVKDGVWDRLDKMAQEIEARPAPAVAVKPLAWQPADDRKIELGRCHGDEEWIAYIGDERHLHWYRVYPVSDGKWRWVEQFRMTYINGNTSENEPQTCEDAQAAAQVEFDAVTLGRLSALTPQPSYVKKTTETFACSGEGEKEDGNSLHEVTLEQAARVLLREWDDHGEGFLGELVCYSPDSYHGSSNMEPDADGDWVKFADVEVALRALAGGKGHE